MWIGGPNLFENGFIGDDLCFAGDAQLIVIVIVIVVGGEVVELGRINGFWAGFHEKFSLGINWMIVNTVQEATKRLLLIFLVMALLVIVLFLF